MERQLSTLRVQVPKRLLQSTAWQSLTANPATILRTIVDPSTFHSTFRWSSITHKTKFGGDEEVLEGYLKIDKDGLFNVLRKSGSKGMFLTQVFKENPNPPKVSWVPRVAEETDHQYMARVQQIGHSKQIPLKFRVGGGACLGLIGVDPENKPSLWQVAGVPTKWTGQDLTRCLEGAGFTDTMVLRRPFRNHPWMVVTRVTDEFQSSSVFGVESNNVCLTLSKPPPKNSGMGRQNVRVGRWHEKRTPVVTPPLGVPENDARRDNREPAQVEQQAQKRHKADTTAPYTLVDCGGAGNCGWNSVAVGLGIKKGLTYEDACKDIETTVRTLRADVCSHVLRHSADYKPSWAPDIGETEVTAAGAVPTTFEEWAASLLRDRQWMCGMALEAAARRCGTKIVILEENNGDLLEPLVCGTGKKREDPIILYLKDEHFQLVLRQDGIELPKDWVQAKSSGEPIRINLRGAGRFWSDKTPSKTSAKDSSKSMRKTCRAWSAKTPSRVTSVAGGHSAAPTFRLWRKTSLHESERQGDGSTVAPSAYQCANTGDVQFGSAATSQAHPTLPGGKLGTLHPITEEDKRSRPWWTCLHCGYQIYIKLVQGKYSAAHFTARSRHLCKVHGYSKAPPLPRHGVQDKAIRDEARIRLNQAIGWKAVWEAYMKNRWPGSHRISEKGIRTVTKSGYVVYKQKCQDCGAVMCRGDVPKRDPCVRNPTSVDAPPRPERVKLWRGFQKCRQPAMRAARKERYKSAMNKKESALYANSIRIANSKKRSLSKLADGSKATRKNHRGEVIGEASNPGPAGSPSSRSGTTSKHCLNLWSTNIRSWRKHGEFLLSEATKANVQVVCCQETNLPQEDFAVQMWAARQLGWNIIFTESFDCNNGGLAVAVREPLAVVALAETSNDTGQMIQVEVHSSSVPFRLFNVYQRPGRWDPSISHPMLGLENTPWVCCGDFNCDVHNLGFGTLVGTARHTTSKHPIDAIFASEMFSQMQGGEQQSFGNDHSIAWASFQGSWVTPPGDSTIWTFRQCRQTKNASLVSEQPDRRQDWANSVCSKPDWQKCLSKDSEAIWAQWIKDFETFLVVTQQVIPAKRSPLIGAVPSLVSAGHHGAPGQTHRERELRRGIRRAREAAFLSRKGAPVSGGLAKNIAKSLEPKQRHLVSNHQWTQVETELLGRLDQVLKQKTESKKEVWSDEMHNLSKATNWIKQCSPPQFLLAGGVAGRVACLKVIHNVWKTIFGCDTDADADPQKFCDAYQEDLPEETQPSRLPKLNQWQVRNIAATMAHKATGPDGISAQHLLSLPEEGWERVTQMLNRFETLQTFPAAVQHWKVVFIPKGNAPEGVSADQMRPLSVASIIYRLWARCRIKQCNEVVERHLAPLQATTQLDPEIIHLVLRGECPASSYQYGLALDYKKAFDSVNIELGLHLLERVGLPQNVLGLLSSQWRNQTRWLSFAGAIHAEPLVKVPSLPQGDPFSPLTLALILSCPAKRCARLFPMVKCALYLDDRTLTSRNVESLVDAAADWDRLSQVTRLCTNHLKSQLWGRTSAAAANLKARLCVFPVKSEVEVLGYYLGANPEQHPKRLARVETGKKVARKIAVLPIPQHLKAQLAMSLLTSTAAWGQDITKTQILRAAHDQHLKNFKLAVLGVKETPHSDSQSNTQSRSSPHLRQLLVLGHGSDLIFAVVTKYMSALARWYKYRQPDNSLLQRFQRHSADVWRAVKKHLYTWGWQEQEWGHWAVPREVHFQITMSKEHRAVSLHHLRQSWRKANLFEWLDSERNDAQVALNVGLDENIHDGLVDSLRKVYKQLNTPHEKAVITGGMHTAASTRWGGTQEIVDEEGNMCCPDCGQAQHPTLEHVFWYCNSYDHLRTVAPPSCPLARRLGWSHDTSVSQSLSLLRQMGKIREAEVINRMRRVRLQQARVIRGGGRAVSHVSTKELPCHTQVNETDECSWPWHWRSLLRKLLALLRSALERSCGSWARMLPCPDTVYSFLIAICGSHLLHVFRRVLSWFCCKAVASQFSEENRPQKMPARPSEAKIKMVNLGPCLTLGSACNSLIKSLVSWASYCVVFGPQVENNWPTRARMEKLNKKIQPVWLEVEYKVEPVWLLPTSMNSFDLNSFENSFGLPRVTAFSFLRSCLPVYFVHQDFLGHLCGGPPGPEMVSALRHGFRG